MSLEQKDLSRMLETAEVAARLAGQRAMEESSYIKVSVKGPDQLVTQADTICQQIIIDRIKEIYPDDGFIGEEGPSRRDVQAAAEGQQKGVVGNRPDRRNNQFRERDAAVFGIGGGDV